MGSMMNQAMKHDFAINISKDFFKSTPNGWVEKKIKRFGPVFGIDVFGRWSDSQGNPYHKYLFNISTIGPEAEEEANQIVNGIIEQACVN